MSIIEKSQSNNSGFAAADVTHKRASSIVSGSHYVQGLIPTENLRL